MGFKENLRMLRNQLGLTQMQMAGKAGVPFRTYQNWEAGVRSPHLQASAALARALNVTVDELTGGEATSPQPPPEFDADFVLGGSEEAPGIRLLAPVCTNVRLPFDWQWIHHESAERYELRVFIRKKMQAKKISASKAQRSGPPCLAPGEQAKVVVVTSAEFQEVEKTVANRTKLHWQVSALDSRGIEIASSRRCPFTVLTKEDVLPSGSRPLSLLYEALAARARYEEALGLFDEALKTLSQIPDPRYRDREIYKTIVNRWRDLDVQMKQLSKKVNSGAKLEEVRLARESLLPLLKDYYSRQREETHQKASKRSRR